MHNLVRIGGGGDGGDGGVTDFDFGDGCFEFADAAGDDNDIGALCCEFLRDAETHSLRGTGDEDGLEVRSVW